MGLLIVDCFVVLVCVTVEIGRVIAQAVSRRFLIAEARVRAQVSPCGICCGQSATGTGFFVRVLRFSPVSIISPLLHIRSCIMWRMGNGPVSGRSSTETVSPHRNNEKLVEINKRRQLNLICLQRSFILFELISIHMVRNVFLET
jgi:hypothetical protein